MKERIKTIGSFLVVGAILVLPFITKVPEKKAPLVPPSVYAHKLTIGGVPLDVAIAHTQEEQSRGLSGTSSLSANEGMLFVFDAPKIPNFWMKDMNYSIDMIWIDNDLRVSGVVSNVTPDTYPEEFSPDTPIRFVLEVPAGFTEANNIISGTEVTF